MTEPEIFLSYTGGPYEPVVSIFRKTLTDRLEHPVADWIREPHTSGDLWENLKNQMTSCRVFILFITSDYAIKMAGDELHWLIEKCNSNTVWAESRLVIPVILDRKAELIWEKNEKRFPTSMQGVVRQKFVNDQGKCDLTTTHDGEMVLDPDHVPTIDRLKDDIRAHLAIAVVEDEIATEEDRENRPENVATETTLSKVFVFGGAEWSMTGESNEMRDKLVRVARTNLTPDQRDRLIDVGDEWAERRRLIKNAHLFAGGGNAHAIVVGDRELLDAFAYENDDDGANYAAFLKSKIDKNLSSHRGWQVKDHFLWLPESVSPKPSDLNLSTDLRDFVIDGGSYNGMAAKICGLLAGRASANILYQSPGRQFEDIAIWARTRFAKEVQLVHAQIDTFRDHDVLRRQISGILKDGEDSIILIVGDGAIDASNLGRRDTHDLFQARLYNVETALQDTLREFGCHEREEASPRFGRIFLQYRNPSHTFGELSPKPNDPLATWVPVRFNAARQPCNSCMETVRELIGSIASVGDQ